MLIVRGDKFVKYEDKYYIVGSSSNLLYSNLIECMGPVSLMAWVVEEGQYDISKLEELNRRNDLDLIVNRDNISFLKKCKAIKGAIKDSDAVNLKLPLINSIIGCYYARKYKKPYVIESGGDAFASLWNHGGGCKYKILSVPIDIVTRYFHSSAKYIIYCSQDFLQRKYPSKAKQIGIPDVVMEKPDPEILKLRIKHIGTPKKQFVLGLIGATNAEYRGHDTLIKAAAILNKKGYCIKIRFLGGGTADEKRKKLAEKLGILDKIEFCGKIPHSDVLSWIDKIDVLVMPTKVESLGRAIVEAMSRGCPVIGSKETAINEQLGSDCLVPAKDYIIIAKKVERMILDKEYITYCAYENFYRSYKYVSEISNRERKKFYDYFYEEVGYAKNKGICQV